MKSTLKIFIFALMLSLILTVATSAAADDMTFNQSDSNETTNIEPRQSDYLAGTESEYDSLSPQDDADSFHDLQMLIDNSDDVVNLERDYIYNDTTDHYPTLHDKNPPGHIYSWRIAFSECGSL